MSLDLQVLEKSGLTTEKLKAAFSKDKPDEKIKELTNLIQSRIQEGLTRNLRESRHWAAIDAAFDASFYQVTPTLARSLLSGKMDSAGVLKAAQDWGLTHMIAEGRNAKGEKTKTIDLPAFFQITVPIAKAYVTIRTAKIFNDRNLFPLFKFEPSRLTTTNKMRCEIITDRIQTMSSQMDYPGVMRQAIMNKNIYGVSLMFPAECWYTEKQTHEKKGKEEEKIIREGLRYNLPHPSRVAWDLNYRVGTFNSDTGCSWALYWQIQRYGDVKDNEMYWNTDKISFGTNWMTFAPTFFATVYPCVMKFPDQSRNLGATSGAGEMDRESQAGFYAASQSDQAVTLTQTFMKIQPKKYGLGTYDHKVWFRFVVASDSTIIYAEPLAYNPVIYRGYDAHEERELNTSLVLESIPFQDHISNLMTQQLLSIKQNLISVVFVNEDAVGKGTMDKIHNLGQKLITETTFVPYSAKMMQFAGKDLREAFIPVNFPRLDTTVILQGIRSMLDMMERVLVMSSQEIGAAASHEQTAQETRVIQQSTSNRLNFTASYDDDADLAWKKQLYDALMAYGDDDMYAQVGTTADADAKKALEKLGFTVEEEGDQKKNTKSLVKGGKTALLYEEFSSTRAAAYRIDNVALSNAMVQLLQVVVSNQAMFEVIGPVQAIKMINEIGNLAGFAKDWKLEVVEGTSPEQAKQETVEEVGAMLEQLKKVLEGEMQQAIAPLGEGLQQVAGQVQQIGQAVPQLAEQLAQLSQAVPEISKGLQQALEAVGQKDAEQDQAIAQIVQLIQVAQGAMPPQPQQPPMPPPPGPGMSPQDVQIAGPPMA